MRAAASRPNPPPPRSSRRLWQVDASLSLIVEQSGVAPFYYGLSLTVSAPSLSDAVESDSDLSTLLPGERRNVTLALGRVGESVLNEPLTLRLDSPMLLEGQGIAFATTTPWSTGESSTVLQFDFPLCALSESPPSQR